jgi:hypothetical protein
MRVLLLFAVACAVVLLATVVVCAALIVAGRADETGKTL